MSSFRRIVQKEKNWIKPWARSHLNWWKLLENYCCSWFKYVTLRSCTVKVGNLSMHHVAAANCSVSIGPARSRKMRCGGRSQRQISSLVTYWRTLVKIVVSRDRILFLRETAQNQISLNFCLLSRRQNSVIETMVFFKKFPVNTTQFIAAAASPADSVACMGVFLWPKCGVSNQD